LKKLTKAEILKINEFYGAFEIRNVSTKWHQFYKSCNDNFYEDYVPESLFYLTIEPMLNKAEFNRALMDKNFLQDLFPDIKQPRSVLKNINGFYYNDGNVIDKKRAVQLFERAGSVVIKPTLETGGGKNVMVYTENTLNQSNIIELFDDFNKDFIVQKVVEQHPNLKKLNSTSLNTFRVMSYFNEKEVRILSTIIRMGGKGDVTDNGTTGGISCGVKDNGELKDQGFRLTGERLTGTSEGLRFSDVSLPFMDKISAVLSKAHTRLPYFKLVSWDLSVDAEGDVVLIEFNVSGQGLNSHQLNNGPVLSKLLKELY